MAKKSSKTPIDNPPSASSEEDDEEETSTQTPLTQETSTKTGTSKSKKSRSKTVSELEPKESKRSKIKTDQEGSDSLDLKMRGELSSTKRPAVSELDPKESERSKKKDDEEEFDSADVVLEGVEKTGGEEKKQLFQRLFNKDDEIAVLEGLLDYSTKNGVDPFADTNAFYELVKDSIHTDVSKAQLLYKARRLRKKFVNNVRRSKQGEDRKLNNPHEQKVFELSKKIWGKEGISGKLESSVKGNCKTTDTSNTKEEDGGEESIEVEMESSKSLDPLFGTKSSVSNLETEILKHGFDVVGGEKGAALEEKRRKLQVSELELFVQRKELIIEMAKSLLESYKSEDA